MAASDTLNLPEFVSEASISPANKFKIRVAVDFGTDGIGTLQHDVRYSNPIDVDHINSISIRIWRSKRSKNSC